MTIRAVDVVEGVTQFRTGSVRHPHRERDRTSLPNPMNTRKKLWLASLVLASLSLMSMAPYGYAQEPTPVDGSAPPAGTAPATAPVDEGEPGPTPADPAADENPPTTASDGSAAAQPSENALNEPFDEQEIGRAAGDFFGSTTEGLAKLIQRAFSENGEPNAYITGTEGSGAIGVGLRYGKGELHFSDGTTVPVFWRGPSVGWDFGGNASKVFTLVYHLRSTDELFKRYPGVDGSLYFVAGFGMNYQRHDTVTLAPIRTGVGLRAGANVGYLAYSADKTWVPF